MFKDISARSPIFDTNVVVTGTPASSFSRFSLDGGYSRPRGSSDAYARAPSTRMSFEATITPPPDSSVICGGGREIEETPLPEEKDPAELQQVEADRSTTVLDEPRKPPPMSGGFNLLQRFEEGQIQPTTTLSPQRQQQQSPASGLGGVGRSFGQGNGKYGNKVQPVTAAERTPVEKLGRVVVEKATSIVVAE